MPFLIVKVIGGRSQPRVVFSTNISDGNFEKAVCSKIVRRSHNTVFGVNRITQNLGVRVVSYAPGAYEVFMEGMVL